jgi:hypothetical protein
LWLVLGDHEDDLVAATVLELGLGVLEEVVGATILVLVLVFSDLEDDLGVGATFLMLGNN